MSFYFAFSANSRTKLHELADRQTAYPHVPAAAVAFVRESIDAFPDGTIIQVTAHGHKAQVAHHPETSGPAKMEITVTPIFLTE